MAGGVTSLTVVDAQQVTFPVTNVTQDTILAVPHAIIAVRIVSLVVQDRVLVLLVRMVSLPRGVTA